MCLEANFVLIKNAKENFWFSSVELRGGQQLQSTRVRASWRATTSTTGTSTARTTSTPSPGPNTTQWCSALNHDRRYHDQSFKRSGLLHDYELSCGPPFETLIMLLQGCDGLVEALQPQQEHAGGPQQEGDQPPGVQRARQVRFTFKYFLKYF